MSAHEELTARAKLKQDMYYKEADRLEVHRLEGLKAFLALNGGGCVAMLGFMQALIPKGDTFNSFKPFGSMALTCFAAGLVLSALLPITRMLDVKNTLRALASQGESHDRWEHATSAIWILAGLAFMAGLGYVGVGISRMDANAPGEPMARGAPSLTQGARVSAPQLPYKFNRKRSLRSSGPQKSASPVAKS